MLQPTPVRRQVLPWIPRTAICQTALRIRKDTSPTAHILRGDVGSFTDEQQLVQMLLEAGIARAWFHGHSVRHYEIARGGRGGRMQVVPLKDIAFPIRGPDTDRPGDKGWCCATLTEEDIAVDREPPKGLNALRRKNWFVTKSGLWVCPPLRNIAWQMETQARSAQ